MHVATWLPARAARFCSAAPASQRGTEDRRVESPDWQTVWAAAASAKNSDRRSSGGGTMSSDAGERCDNASRPETVALAGPLPAPPLSPATKNSGAPAASPEAGAGPEPGAAALVRQV